MWRLLERQAFLRKNEKSMILKLVINLLHWISSCFLTIFFDQLIKSLAEKNVDVMQLLKIAGNIILLREFINTTYILLSIFYLNWIITLDASKYRNIYGGYKNFSKDIDMHAVKEDLQQ
jgi:hypothetical protein